MGTMEEDILGWGFYKSPASQRVYFLSQGFVVGEVPAGSERDVGQVAGALHVAAELDYVRRKIGNLERYTADLDAVKAGADRSQPFKSAADFRPVGLAGRDARTMPVGLRPRLTQLGNTGAFAYAHGGWRSVIRPTPAQVELLKKLPNPSLIGDDGIATFLQRERAEAESERLAARGLLDRLNRHPDNDDVNRSYG